MAADSTSVDLSLLQLLEQVAAGNLEVTAAAQQLQTSSPFADRSVATPEVLQLDVDRQRRCGFPEAIYAPEKSPEVIAAAFAELQLQRQHALATRVSPEQAAFLQAQFPEALWVPTARTVRLMATDLSTEVDPSATKSKDLLAAHAPYVLTAGTTDRGVAEEAAETLRWMGLTPRLLFDIGVAGPQRLLQRVEELQSASVIVVAAGMEGALPSVVGGWVSCPVVAVPTSVGYGANFGGVSALLSMLNSCAANVCTVNIDAGFKAGYLAGLIATQASRLLEKQ